jgi:2-polyprenyl-3-methyl-5-hydroxy-6-metoxy-1,4-benzoquinol methylase
MRPKILIISPNPSDGTAMYRASPYRRLNVDIATPKGIYLDWPELYDVDVVFFQRPASQVDVLNIETCKRFNKPVIVDYDDYSFEVDDRNPAFDYYERDAIKSVVKTILKQADAVTVSTQGLKDALLEQVPEAKIQIIHNAVDDKIFSLEPSYHERNKIILLRGGGSHDKDWTEYKDGILQILREFPDYTLAVMGHQLPWFREIPDNQLKVYKFTDIPSYFDLLMQLRPEIMIVPLQDTKFNRCKSNIAWIEGTLAGAAVIAPDLPEFSKNEGCLTVANKTNFVAQLIANLFDKFTSQVFYETSLKEIPRLSEINELRIDLIENLTRSTKKYSPKTLTATSPATDEEFHNYSLSHGHTQDFHQYQQAHSSAAEWLVKTLKPKTALELGCGTGATLVELLKRGVMAYGLELNPKSYEYFKEHHPMYGNQIYLGDFTKEPIENDVPGDLLLSIEVFEHIDQPEEWWNSFIKDLSTKFRHFYFSSTPYSDSEYFESWWGHINLRKPSEWIKLMESNGWKYSTNPRLLTSWDMIFDSVSLTKTNF